jgi:hypothetical protein
VAAAAVVAGVALWLQAPAADGSRARSTSRGVATAVTLDGASKAWLAKSMVAHGFTDLSRAARMAIDYVAQEAVADDVFTKARVAAKVTVRARSRDAPCGARCMLKGGWADGGSGPTRPTWS